jgi:hypothetical protein
MSELLVLAAIFLVPTLTGAALGLSSRGWIVALGLAGVAVASGLALLATTPEAGERLGHAVMTNLSFLVAAELAGAWLVVALGRYWLRRRKA